MTVYRSTGSAIRVDIENTYQYHGHEYDNAEDFLGTLNYNLNMAKHIDQYSNKDVRATLQLAKELAQDFVTSQHPANPATRYKKTNTLRDSIQYDTTTASGGPGGRLFANARDRKGHRYAGHIEYGYTDRGGNPRGPWPFLRPAMRLALNATKYNFAKTMRDLMFGEFNASTLSIGSKDASLNIFNTLGGRGNAIDQVTNSFQSYSDSGTGRWSSATNGIGFVSGVSSGFTANANEWKSGQL